MLEIVSLDKERSCLTKGYSVIGSTHFYGHLSVYDTRWLDLGLKYVELFRNDTRARLAGVLAPCSPLFSSSYNTLMGSGWVSSKQLVLIGQFHHINTGKQCKSRRRGLLTRLSLSIQLGRIRCSLSERGYLHKPITND